MSVLLNEDKFSSFSQLTDEQWLTLFEFHIEKCNEGYTTIIAIPVPNGNRDSYLSLHEFPDKIYEAYANGKRIDSSVSITDFAIVFDSTNMRY